MSFGAGETWSIMSSAGRSLGSRSHNDDQLLATAGTDPAARWRAIEACRGYLRLVARRGRWADDADLRATSDLVQGTVLRGWNEFSKFRGRTPGQLRAWLRAILIHAALNGRRRTRAAHAGSARRAAGAAATTTNSPSRIAGEKDEREVLDATLERLPVQYRLVIRMRLWDRATFVQIGAAIGVSEDAARMLYSRAIARLRQSMKAGY
jgi:RNA polymerase sigma-70 factor, ECF subfamily